MSGFSSRCFPVIVGLSQVFTSYTSEAVGRWIDCNLGHRGRGNPVT